MDKKFLIWFGGQLGKRLESLAIRVVWMVAAVFIDTAIQGLSSVDLSPQLVVLIGLVLGEASKFVYAHLSWSGKDMK